jgi:hypothetical protein
MSKVSVMDKALNTLAEEFERIQSELKNVSHKLEKDDPRSEKKKRLPNVVELSKRIERLKSKIGVLIDKKDEVVDRKGALMATIQAVREQSKLVQQLKTQMDSVSEGASAKSSSGNSSSTQSPSTTANTTRLGLGSANERLEEMVRNCTLLTSSDDGVDCAGDGGGGGGGDAAIRSSDQSAAKEDFKKATSGCVITPDKENSGSNDERRLESKLGII